MMRVLVGGATSAATGEFRALLRAADGRWACVQASVLRGGEPDQVAVSTQLTEGCVTSRGIVRLRASWKAREVT
jgi:hypothetical protein